MNKCLIDNFINFYLCSPLRKNVTCTGLRKALKRTESFKSDWLKKISCRRTLLGPSPSSISRYCERAFAN